MAAEQKTTYKSTEHFVFDDVSGITKRTGVIMQYNDFIHVPDHVGGHVSVFLWYPANVKDKNGHLRREIIFRLCVTNHIYLSNFGGGFKPYKGGILNGLEKELSEEVPLWSEYIINEIKKHSKKPDEGQCLFLGIRQKLADHVKPVYKHGKRQTPTPIKSIVFVPVSAKIINELGFEPTNEIRAILDKTLPDFHRIVDSRPNMGSDGIRIYHVFRNKMKDSPVLKRTLDRYFEKDLPITAHLLESNLTDDHVAVTLENGETTLRFSHIRYNNDNASKNLDEAWNKREEYGKKIMKWKRGMPRIFPPITFRPISAPPSITPKKRENNNEKNEKKQSPQKDSSSGSKTRSKSRSPPKEDPSENNAFTVVKAHKHKKNKTVKQHNKK